KQEPVDIPQVETRVLEEVLALPWGFEIYGLLTRWNPLNLRRPLPKPATGRKVLVVGLGPAGFTLAHHLMNDGHAVVAVDALTIDGAFALGFDHIALCAGAGRPTIVPMKNGLAAGVRQASDFLMALQLTGAAKTDSLANLQVRLPVVIIGGGLTAIDTATEALAYYPLQVEKFLSRYETLIAERGEAAVRADWSAHEAEVAAEFMQHAREIRAERALAAREGRKPQLAELM